jgi:hypothetical protein
MTDRLCICGHWESEHQESLFGIVCRGSDWHDTSKFACKCTEFRAKETN